MTLVDNKGNSALHHASSNLNFVATKVLIEAGSPLEIVNKDVSETTMSGGGGGGGGGGVCVCVVEHWWLDLGDTF